LRHIATKDDFRAEIRDAKVMAITSSEMFHGIDEWRATSFDNPHIQTSYNGFAASPELDSPPQVLILSLDSGHLAFIYLIEDPSRPSKCKFVMSIRKLATETKTASSLGKSIAVDPQ